MNEHVYEGKVEQDVLINGLKDLGLEEQDVLYFTSKEKQGILKKEIVKVHIFLLTDVMSYMKDYLKNITTDMGLDVTMESKIRNNQIIIKMYSDNNNILIGKEGRTLKALTTVVKQIVYNKTHKYPYILLDVSNYKEKQEKHLIHLAHKIAKEVSETKNPVSLENMNSYERRIVHNALSEWNSVYTKSDGEEPNRHVVVYPKED